MQINNNGITNNANSNGTSNAKAASDKSTDKLGSNGTDSQSDSVELSSQARGLTDLSAKISSASDIDSNRVESIKAAINNGEYAIDTDKIASKLLASDDLF